MSKQYGTLINTNGDVLTNYRVQVLDSAGAIVEIYEDSGGTRFTDDTGASVNYATSNELGYYEFYWTAAAGQVLQILDASGELDRPPVTDFADNLLIDNLGGSLPQAQVTGLDASLADAANRVNHTGVQSIATITDLQTELDAKAASAEIVAVDNKVDVIGTVTGLGGNAPSIAQFDHNFLSSDASSSRVAAGGVDQPNVVGVPLATSEQDGDGSTTAFAFNPGFVVTDEEYLTIRVWLVTLSTGGESLESEDTDFTVSGYGTSSLTINMTSAPTTAQGIRIRAYAKSDAGNSPLLVFNDRGYDNVSDGDGSMTIIDGAHHTDIGNPAGHNTFAGGSSNIARNSSSYTYIAGLSGEMSGSLGGAHFGLRGFVTGTTGVHFGSSGRVGSYSAHFGEMGEVETLYSSHFGRKGKSRIAGDFVRGIGQAADADAGMMDVHRYSLRRVVPGAATTTMAATTGSSTFVMPTDSQAHIDAVVHLTDTNTSSNDFRVIRVRTTVRRGSGTATTLIGSNTTGASMQTVLDEPTGFSPSAGNWEAQVFISAASGGFIISARGEDGKTVQALADVKVTLIDKGAAEV